jgi:hypothetical protein
LKGSKNQKKIIWIKKNNKHIKHVIQIVSWHCFYYIFTFHLQTLFFETIWQRDYEKDSLSEVFFFNICCLKTDSTSCKEIQTKLRIKALGCTRDFFFFKSKHMLFYSKSYCRVFLYTNMLPHHSMPMQCHFWSFWSKLFVYTSQIFDRFLTFADKLNWKKYKNKHARK